MYDYRRMTPEERQSALQCRRERGYPLHAPPHLEAVAGEYLITAACYEHRPFFEDPSDLSFLMEEILVAVSGHQLTSLGWVFLPNHYHMLLQIPELSGLSEMLRKVHSRVATTINGRKDQRGTRIWYRFTDRLIRSERHGLATLNYIHFNPVRHGYVDRAEDWPWSSLHSYVEARGERWLADIWKHHPIGDYGKGWDW